MCETGPLNVATLHGMSSARLAIDAHFESVTRVPAERRVWLQINPEALRQLLPVGYAVWLQMGTEGRFLGNEAQPL
jgi:hypothetical protein